MDLHGPVCKYQVGGMKVCACHIVKTGARLNVSYTHSIASAQKRRGREEYVQYYVCTVVANQESCGAGTES